MLTRKADNLADEAEKGGCINQSHNMLVQSNALRKDARAKNKIEVGCSVVERPHH